MPMRIWEDENGSRWLQDRADRVWRLNDNAVLYEPVPGDWRLSRYQPHAPAVADMRRQAVNVLLFGDPEDAYRIGLHPPFTHMFFVAVGDDHIRLDVEYRAHHRGLRTASFTFQVTGLDALNEAVT